MLLYSSQVSVTISSLIAFIFTVALFLSGYFLQQKTLHDLRAEIRPQLPRNVYGANLYLSREINKGNLYSEKLHWKNNPESEDTAFHQVVDATDDQVKNIGIGHENYDSILGASKWQKRMRKIKSLNEAAANMAKKVELHGKESASRQPFSPALSRAQRRKLIRSQILADGEGEIPQGYRRRHV
ncbi:hypothetical protein EV44_g0112 [Erysiphe necator]|uniref:Uncharacterized protein n=1 Tax=Uncinula necator TaxID=52586 RepID=A0A0B1P1M9_UNCNE|nr:hypothetical protein EV44_g0112 [Erysiphe necator]